MASDPNSQARFNHHSFISYAHNDNEKGWVDELHEELRYKLTEWLGYKVDIWRDPKMPGNVYIAPHLKDKLGRTAVLVAVVSPSFITSDWCPVELSDFCQLAQSNGGLAVEDKLRIFKVVKTFLEDNHHPEQFRDQVGYKFYGLRPETNQLHEFRRDPKDLRYWDVFGKLAWDIRNVLFCLMPPPQLAAGARSTGGASAVLGAPPPAPKDVIYLAETTYDLKREHKVLREELAARGYQVLPAEDERFDYELQGYEQAVRERLQRARLSIHLVGRRYGIIPDGESGTELRSVVRLQNEIAAERACDRDFARVVWIPGDLQEVDEAQARFIHLLKTDAEFQRGAEPIIGAFDELKKVVLDRLAQFERAALNGAGGRAAARRRVYLICDRRDADQIGLLYQCLHRAGCEVKLPLLDEEAGAGEAGELEMHRKNLLECEGVIIYYNQASQRWFEYNESDLGRVSGPEQGLGDARPEPLRARAIYVAGAQTRHKLLFDSHVAPVLKNFGDFDARLLDQFLADLG